MQWDSRRYQQGIEKLVTRYDKCLSCGEDYVEMQWDSRRYQQGIEKLVTRYDKCLSCGEEIRGNAVEQLKISPGTRKAGHTV
jgi:ribosomal protein L32